MSQAGACLKRSVHFSSLSIFDKPCSGLTGKYARDLAYLG